MAAKKRTNDDTDNPNAPKTIPAPEGYEDISSELQGAWDSDSDQPIEFIPRYVSLSDNGQEKQKPSALLAAEAVKPLECVTRDGEVVTVKPGGMFGIWLKPGMRDMFDYADSPIYMVANGERDVNKASPMKVFACFAKKGSKKKPLTVKYDWRKQSKFAPIPFDLQAEQGVGTAKPDESEPDTDNVPDDEDPFS